MIEKLLSLGHKGRHRSAQPRIGARATGGSEKAKPENKKDKKRGKPRAMRGALTRGSTARGDHPQHPTPRPAFPPDPVSTAM